MFHESFVCQFHFVMCFLKRLNFECHVENEIFHEIYCGENENDNSDLYESNSKNMWCAINETISAYDYIILDACSLHKKFFFILITFLFSDVKRKQFFVTS